MKDHIFELRRKIWRHTSWSSQLYTQFKPLWNQFKFMVFHIFIRVRIPLPSSIQTLIICLIVSITKFLIVFVYSHTNFLCNLRVVTWYPTGAGIQVQLFVIGYPIARFNSFYCNVFYSFTYGKHYWIFFHSQEVSLLNSVQLL